MYNHKPQRGLWDGWQSCSISLVHSHPWSLRWGSEHFLSSPLKSLIPFTLSWFPCFSSHWGKKGSREKIMSSTISPLYPTWNPLLHLYLDMLFSLLYLWLRCHPPSTCRREMPHSSPMQRLYFFISSLLHHLFFPLYGILPICSSTCSMTSHEHKKEKYKERKKTCKACLDSVFPSSYDYCTQLLPCLSKVF